MKIAYLAPEIPALSATFVYNEILQLEELGVDVVPFSVHRPFSEVIDMELDELKKKVIYVYEYSKTSVAWSHIQLLVNHPLRYLSTLWLFLSDMLKVGFFTRNALGLVFRYFFAGSVADNLIRNQCQHLHVHFAHVPTDIAMYAASFSGITFSVMAHANDLFERGWLLPEKVERSAFFATISEFNIRYLASNKAVVIDKLCIIRCGVNSEQFVQRNDFSENQPIRIGVVGRLVEKKGIDTLIRAIALLKEREQHVKLFVAGSGPLENDLVGLVKSQDLDQNNVMFLGAIPHSQVADFITSLDIFILPCKKDENGDMDGIPVVLMEAMLSGVPVISTDLSGIPELVINEETGLLTQPDDEQGLAEAISNMINNENLRKSMIEHAVSKVKNEFSLEDNTKKLNAMFNTVINNKSN